MTPEVMKRVYHRFNNRTQIERFDIGSFEYERTYDKKTHSLYERRRPIGQRRWSAVYKVDVK